MEQLKRLSGEVDKKLNRLERYSKKEGKGEVSEAKLFGELECLDKSHKVLEKELEMLKAKTEVDSSYARVVYLESTIRQNVQRNEALAKELKMKGKGLKKTDKRFQYLQMNELVSPQTEVILCPQL